MIYLNKKLRAIECKRRQSEQEKIRVQWMEIVSKGFWRFSKNELFFQFMSVWRSAAQQQALFAETSLFKYEAHSVWPVHSGGHHT